MASWNDPRNERQANAAITAALLNAGFRSIGSDVRVRIEELAADPVLVPIRRPGEDRDRPAPPPAPGETYGPGFRQIGGQWFYSAAWLND